jgi:hypothetical protein
LVGGQVTDVEAGTAPSGAGANQYLSNLLGPTDIPQSLLPHGTTPGIVGNLTLGTLAAPWDQIFSTYSHSIGGYFDQLYAGTNNHFSVDTNGNMDANNIYTSAVPNGIPRALATGKLDLSWFPDGIGGGGGSGTITGSGAVNQVAVFSGSTTNLSSTPKSATSSAGAIAVQDGAGTVNGLVSGSGGTGCSKINASGGRVTNCGNLSAIDITNILGYIPGSSTGNLSGAGTAGYVPYFTGPSTLASLALASQTPGPGKLPIADNDGTLAAWVPYQHGTLIAAVTFGGGGTFYSDGQWHTLTTISVSQSIINRVVVDVAATFVVTTLNNSARCRIAIFVDSTMYGVPGDVHGQRDDSSYTLRSTSTHAIINGPVPGGLITIKGLAENDTCVIGTEGGWNSFVGTAQLFR